MDNLTIYTAMGGMKIIYLEDLGDFIETKKVQSQIVRVPMEIKPITSDFLDLSLPFQMESIRTEEYKLEPFLQISNQEMRNYYNVSYVNFIEKEYLAKKQAVVNEFKIMVAQKKPDEFIKDLTLEAINDLSNKYAVTTGRDDFIGIETKLSPYQKFFSIISPEDLKFFMSDKIRMEHNDSIVYFGKLVCLNDWVMYRYENLEYLNELSAKRMVT